MTVALAVGCVPAAAFAEVGYVAVPLQTDGAAVRAVPGTLGEAAVEFVEENPEMKDFSDVDLVEGTYAEGEVLVVFGENTETSQAENALSALAVEEPELYVDDEDVETGAVVTVPLPDDVTVADALESLAEDPHVVYAQPNYKYDLIDFEEVEYYEKLDDGSMEQIPAAEVEESFAKAAAAAGVDVESDAGSGSDARAEYHPNDPWTTRTEGQPYQYALNNMNVYEAWDTVKVNRDPVVRVAVLDTGVNSNHVEFTGDPDNDKTPIIVNDYAFDATKGGANQAIDTHGHGTHVSGIIAAEADNNVGVAGASYNAEIVPIKVFPDYTGSTLSAYIISGFDYILDVPGVRVVNMSLGGYGGYGEDGDALFRAGLKEMEEKGIVVVCASGNDNTSRFQYPCDWDECIAVNALDEANEKADYSNFGPLKDICAPGSDIISTYIDVDGRPAGKVYATASGTSMASPNAAAVVALIIKNHPDITNAQLKNILYNTATDLGDPGFDDVYANGLVNAGLAIRQDPSISLVSPSSVLPQTSTMQFEVEGDDNANYFWSIEFLGDTPTDAATINQNGLLVGIYTGNIRVTAVKKADVRCYAQKNISITPLQLKELPTVAPVSSSSLKVSWNPLDDATGYYLFRTAVPTDDGSWETIGKFDQNSTEYFDEGLTCGDMWYYSVQPYTTYAGDELLGQRSAPVGARVAPSQPQNLRVVSLSMADLNISWDVVDQADGYYLYRRIQDVEEEFTRVADVAQPEEGATVEHTDVDLATGTYYEYKVAAYKLFNYREVLSVDSDVAQGCPYGEGWVARGRAPLDFLENVDTVTETTIDFTWTPESGVDGYLLEVPELGRGTDNPIEISGGDTSRYQLADLEQGSMYHCSLRSYTVVDGVAYPSGDRAQVTAATRMAAPTGLAAKQATGGSYTMELSWNPLDAEFIGTSIEQRGKPYGTGDVLSYTGDWVSPQIVNRLSDSSYLLRLSTAAPTLMYGLCDFRARHYVSISAIDRKGAAVKLNGDAGRVYSDYCDSIHGLGSLVTPSLQTVESDGTNITLTISVGRRCQRCVVYRSNARGGVYEAIARIDSPYYDSGLGQTGTCTYTDTSFEESGLYWYYIVGESDVDDAVWTTGRSSVKSGRVTIPERIDIASAEVSAIEDQTYTGEALEPHPTVMVDGETLEEGIDYALSYEDNVELGLATITITGIGSYKGSATATFKIVEATEPLPEQAAWSRIRGETRYDTAAEIAQRSFPDGSCDTAIVACGGNFPDALAASSLAGAYNAPIILVDKNKLPAVSEVQLKRLGVKRAIVIGGTAAVSEKVSNNIESLGIQIERVSGGTRTETAAKVALSVEEIEPSDTVIVACGQNFPDALSISPYAYESKIPIVLTNAQGVLDGATLEAVKSINPENVLLVGGSGVVKDSVADQIGPGVAVQRLSGANRYETSAAIAQWEAGQLRNASVQPKAPLSFEYVGITTGKNYPDALAGAAMMGRLGGVMLLVDSEKNADFNLKYTVPNNKAAMRECFVFGGESAVSNETMEALQKASGR